MLRCTIELVPMGDEDRKRVIGMVEIANDGTGDGHTGNYKVLLKKTPPFSGALKQAWRTGRMAVDAEDEEIITGSVEGHPRAARGSYDLLYRALKACGLEERIPRMFR
jgi:hypothetical protein